VGLANDPRVLWGEERRVCVVIGGGEVRDWIRRAEDGIMAERWRGINEVVGIQISNPGWRKRNTENRQPEPGEVLK
jgi:hypothetical protein